MLLENKRIFIVEDNLQNRVVFRIILAKQGALVEFERAGEETLTRLKVFGQVDLIILDLMLAHNISGYDLFDKIRAVPKFNAVPIIAVSAAEPAVALPKARQQGFAGFIAKPIDDSLFPKQIARVIGGEQVWYGGERFEGINEP